MEGDLIRRLLALRSLDQADHAVEECLAGVGGDADENPIGQDLGTSGYGRAVAAALADDGG